MIGTAKKVFKADLSTLAAGTEIISAPCTVYSITVSKEADGDPIISFSDTATSYSTTYRCEKVVLCAEQHTITLSYPNGLPCSSGLCATSNLIGVDVAVTYE
jgi:hypothetical protein